MKTRPVHTLLLAGIASVAIANAAPADAVLRSMQDELERSRKLVLPGLEAPYFIEYTLDDARAFSTSASLGGTLGSSENRFRLPRVKVRVGDSKFDNTNYVFSDLSGGRFDEQAPVDDDYRVLRRVWWLATDRAYKAAVEAIARKRAALKNVTQPDSIPDLWPAEPVKKTIAAQLPASLASNWVDRIRTLSSAFAAYPEVSSSIVSFSSTRTLFSLVNSEGTVVQRPELLAHFQIQASAFAPDGMTVRDTLSLPRIEEGSLPAQAALNELVTTVGGNIRLLTKAPVGESYSGPVLFEGIAGPQLFAELLAPNLILGRRPVGEPGRTLPFLASELENKIESRILPEFLDCIDDPTRKDWSGTPLLGAYEVDDEGVQAQPVTLVQKGRLKSFLLTRQPVRSFERSNGHARLPGPFGAASASVSNLFINSSESATAEDLRKQFLDLVRSRSKAYGMIVRKMDFPSGAAPDEARKLIQAAQQSGAVRPVSAPLLVYKVFPDGREELVRGLRFRGLTLRSLRDIVAVSKDSFGLHYLNNNLPFALLGGGGYVAPVSVIAPSLLFEELELERPQDDVPKLPLVPAPPLNAVVTSAAGR